MLKQRQTCLHGIVLTGLNLHNRDQAEAEHNQCKNTLKATAPVLEDEPLAPRALSRTLLIASFKLRLK